VGSSRVAVGWLRLVLSFVVFYFSAASVVVLLSESYLWILVYKGTYFKSNKVFNHARAEIEYRFCLLAFLGTAAGSALDCFMGNLEVGNQWQVVCCHF
jgi:hypothetical protein